MPKCYCPGCDVTYELPTGYVANIICSNCKTDFVPSQATTTRLDRQLLEISERAFSEREVMISCSNCYRSVNWNGSLRDMPCPNCRRTICVELLSRSLVHLFCGPTQNNPNGHQLFDLFKFLGEHSWGDGMRIGRHDWVLAGCPANLDDFTAAINELEGVPLTCLCRILQSKPSPEHLSENKSAIANAISERLVKKTPDKMEREYLYGIIPLFPDAALIDVLEQMLVQFPEDDGKSGSILNEVLNTAKTACAASARM